MDHQRAQINTINTRLDALRAYKEKSNSKLIKERINGEIDELQRQKDVHQSIIDMLTEREDRMNDETRRKKIQALNDRGLTVDESICSDVKCSGDNLCNCCLVEKMQEDGASDAEIKLVLKL